MFGLASNIGEFDASPSVASFPPMSEGVEDL